MAAIVEKFRFRPSVDEAHEARRGRFTLYGRTIDFGSTAKIDWMKKVGDDNIQLWRQKLAFFGWAPSILAGDPELACVIEQIVEGFERSVSWSTPEVFRDPWNSYAVAHRILNLSAGLSKFHRNGGRANDIRRTMNFLHRNVRFLLDNIEYELDFNHLERDLAALCVYLEIFPKNGKFVSRMLEREVRHIIRTTVGPDGLQLERSALYQTLFLQSLQLFRWSSVLSMEIVQEVDRMIPLSEHALLTLSHPDGQIALFNDSWFDEVASPAHIVQRSAPQGRTELPSGYIRLAHGDDVVILDAGPIGPKSNPGHGHADFLSIEASVNGLRFIVDPGTYSYAASSDRLSRRSAAAHNGPHVPGYEPINFAGSFRVGKLMAAAIADRAITLSTGDGLTAIGTFRTACGNLARGIVLHPGEGFHVVDIWVSAAEGATRWLIPDFWATTLNPEGAKFSQSDGYVELTILQGRALRVEPSDWSSHYYHLRDATALIVSPEQYSTGIQIASMWFSFGVKRHPPEAAAKLVAAVIAASQDNTGGVRDGRP